jgi:hypothetical protein
MEISNLYFLSALPRPVHSVEERERETEDVDAWADKLESVFTEACALMLVRDGELHAARERLGGALARAEHEPAAEEHARELEEECDRLAEELHEVRAIVYELRSRLDAARAVRRRFAR